MTTTRYHVGIGVKAIVPSGADFELFLDTAYEELLKIEECDSGIVDPDMTANLAEHTFDVEMQVDSEDAADAHVCALTALRTALHAAGVATPRWEVVIDRIRSEIRAAERTLQDA